MHVGKVRAGNRLRELIAWQCHDETQSLVELYRYFYLIAGEPSEVSDKVPQLVNLNTWPATVFIGRDGKAKSTHAGFAAPASASSTSCSRTSSRPVLRVG